MFAGHFFLAFLLVSLFSYFAGGEREHSLYLGIFAGLFGFAPDLDTFYAFTQLPGLLVSGFNPFESFHMATGVIHRGITHSLITGLVTVFLVVAAYENKVYNFLSVLILGFYGLLLNGVIGAQVMVVYGSAIALISYRAADYISREEIFFVGFFGLLSHPFGDLFTGTPPKLLYPVTDLSVSKIILFEQPELNVLIILLSELFLVAAGLTLIIYLGDFNITPLASITAFVVIFYIPFLILIQPSVGTTHRFTLSILGFTTIASLMKS